MWGLCKYKNAFGEPNTGMRKYRIFDVGIMNAHKKIKMKSS